MKRTCAGDRNVQKKRLRVTNENCYISRFSVLSFSKFIE